MPVRRKRSIRPPPGTRGLEQGCDRRMHLILQTLADGLVLGGIYALSAVGFSLIFGVMHVVNLSHGVIVLIGAYISYALWQALGIDPLLTIPLVMVALFGFGYAYQRVVIELAVDR